MKAYSLQNVPTGIPVRAEGKLAEMLQGAVGSSKVPEFAIVTKRFPIAHHTYDGTAEVNILYPSRRKWTGNKSIWIPKGSLFLPLEQVFAERISRLKERFERSNLAHKITVANTQSGADPEIFLIDKKTKQVIPAFAFLPDKTKPYNFFDGNDRKISAFWDGFQAEFTMSSFSCMQEMCRSIQEGLTGILRMARAKFPDAVLSPDSVIDIDPKMMHLTPDHHAALGCSRSSNAYGTSAIQVDNPKMLPFRFAGGHCHFGASVIARASEDQIIEWVKVLDALAGVASVLWFQGMENPIRRHFYGRAGEYRRPKHGLEYRTLGNAWLRHPALFHLMYGFSRISLQFARSGLGKYLDVVPENVRDVVDNYDIPGAKEIVRKNKAIFKSLLGYTWQSDAVKAALNGLEGGLGECMQTPEDIEKNWARRTEWWEAGLQITAGVKI